MLQESLRSPKTVSTASLPEAVDGHIGNRPLPSSRRAEALAIVGALGALCGGAIGSMLLGGLLTRSRSGFHWDVDIAFSLVFGGGFGALVGGLAAPLLGWYCFRHVPLGRAMLVTAVGTLTGAAVGLMAANAPVLGGCLGFTVAGVALRFHPKPARESLRKLCTA